MLIPIYILCLYLQFPMKETITELKPSDLIQCLGQNISQQQLFKSSNLIKSTEEDVEDYFPLKINLSFKNPQQFSFLGIKVEEIHLNTDSLNTIVAIFIKVYNHDLVNRMKSAVGNYSIAGGVSLQDDAPPSYYNWDYMGSCIDLSLNAYKLSFIEQIVRDTGLLIFNKCNMSSYMIAPDQHKQ